MVICRSCADQLLIEPDRGGHQPGMLKLSDLNERTDFQLGPMRVSPQRRRVGGPDGSVHVQPLIMQVFLKLLDQRGQVVTRNELFEQCWGGVYAGDDSLNQAIAKVRRIGE